MIKKSILGIYSAIAKRNLNNPKSTKLKDSFWFPEQSLTCHEAGECQFSQLVGTTTTIGYNSCIKFCRSIPECGWITYHSSHGVCVAYDDCVTLSSEDCPDCISGQSSCHLQENQCWLRGTCAGTLIKEVFYIFSLLVQWLNQPRPFSCLLE